MNSTCGRPGSQAAAEEEQMAGALNSALRGQSTASCGRTVADIAFDREQHTWSGPRTGGFYGFCIK